jgi:hypothetical protein
MWYKLLFKYDEDIKNKMHKQFRIYNYSNQYIQLLKWFQRIEQERKHIRFYTTPEFPLYFLRDSFRFWKRETKAGHSLLK